MQTLRQAIRQLLHRRAASALSIALLALGVGLSVAFYSLLDSALLSGLPFPGGDRMVAFSTRDAAGWPMPLDDYRAIAEAQRAFEWTLPLRTFNTVLTRGERTRGMIGSYVPVDLFERLGVEPRLGRGFEPGDEDPANPSVVVISHRLWHGTYGADPGVLGEEVTLNRERCVIVGVLPPGFRFPLRHDVWGVFGRPGRDWSESAVFGFGLLSRDVSIADARDDLARLVTVLNTETPVEPERLASLDSFVRTNIGERTQGALRAMVFAALGLLVLTCANLANLRLSESLRRRGELDTRLILGSGSGGLVRLLLTEHLLLGLVATGCGLALAYGLTATLGRSLLAGGRLERTFWVDPAIDLRAAGFAAGCALAASLLGALAPVVSTLWRARSGRLAERADARARTTASSRALVGTQIALCFALLAAAGLWSTRADELLGEPPGFRTERLSSLRLSFYQAELAEPADRAELMERIDRALVASPDIAAAAFASAPPWGHVPRSPISATAESPHRDTAPAAKVLDVSSDLFATLELDVLAGRSFTATEAADAGVAIVSRSLADRFDASRAEGPILGRTLTVGSRRAGGPARRFRVVGVVADLGVDRSDHPDRELAVYLPAPVPVHGTTVLIRRQPGPASGRERVEAALEHAAPRVGTLDELTVDQALAASVWVERRLGQIVSLFAAAALSVTAAGLYAVLAVMVRGRRRELGIRAAIGARPRDLQRLVLGETGRQLLLGLAAGGLLLWWGSGWIDRSLTEGLEPRSDVLAVAAAVVVLGCLAGSWGPTRNAARVDPARCLGSE